jgi:hypothetical protein
MSHTIKVIAAGFALLMVCLLVGRFLGDADHSASIAHAALAFVALWLVGAGVNMWIGVTRAGYSVAEEAPIFLVVFLVPAVVAMVVWWRYSRA